jgi:hypothetical protein
MSFMSLTSLMACGHVSDSNYTDPDGGRSPVCSKCYLSQYATAASKKDAKTVVPLKVLRGRTAACWVGEQPGGMRHGEVESSIQLNLFRYQPSKQNDTYYCGCLERID